MSAIRSCDKCDKSIKEKEVLNIEVAFVRTPEEIDQLMASPNFKDCSREEVIMRSVVFKKLEVCKDCYVQFKKDYFGL